MTETTLKQQNKAARIDEQLKAAIRAYLADGGAAYELAAKAGIPGPSISHYLRGNRGLTWSTAAALMAALGLTIGKRPAKVKK